MTTTIQQFRQNNFPFFVGFETLWDTMDKITETRPQSYPPYNLIKHDDYNYTIELAVAGFSSEQITVSHKPERNTLTIRGDQSGNSDDVSFLHRGIAERQFDRTWTVADSIIVNSADLTDGILSISLEKLIPEEKKPKEISISTGRQLLVED
jgi:molecular chaperone IbpA